MSDGAAEIGSTESGAVVGGGDAAGDGLSATANGDATLGDVTSADGAGTAGPEACVPNACGSCGTLNEPIDAACGTCGAFQCDAGSVWCNDPGTTNSCPTWCSSQRIPTGVATRDYQCVDFDNGAAPSNPWMQTLSGSGMLSPSMGEWDSPSYSLMSSVGTSSADTATLTWSDVGSTAVSSVSVTVGIDPVTAGVSFASPWTGQVALFCISTGHNQTCLKYTWNPNQDGGSGLDGYFVESAYTGGIGIGRYCSLPTLATNAWNTVQFVLTPGGNSPLQVSLNGVTSTGGGCLAPFDADTNGSVTVGLANSGTIGWRWTAYFDNMIVAIHR